MNRCPPIATEGEREKSTPHQRRKERRNRVGKKRIYYSSVRREWGGMKGKIIRGWREERKGVKFLSRAASCDKHYQGEAPAGS